MTDNLESPPRRAAVLEKLTPLGLSFCSGVLLFLSDFPVHAWPLQAVALVPWLLALVRCSGWWAALCGLTLGAAFVGPLAVWLEFPAAMAAGLGVYLAALWALMSVGLRWALLLPRPLVGALAAGAVAVAVEWVDCTVVPVWGTAQIFVRVWTASPWAVQLASLAGVFGLVFVVVTGQALVVQLVRWPAHRRRLAVALAVLVLLVGGWTLARLGQQPTTTLRVAAAGWTWGDLDRTHARGNNALLTNLVTPLVKSAARRGAKLVVFPEVSFWVKAHQRAPLLAALGALAREHQVMLVIGYFDRQRNDNRAAFIDAEGAPRGEYVKTHLIPFFEDYVAGSGDPVVVTAGGLRLGAMICQDDNFTDLARAYGLRAAQIMAVPTNDWEQVRHYHLENSIFRAVENDYGVVRGASNGISAIISPRGEVLQRMDHFQRGPGVVVADLPLFAGAAPYSHAGDWLVWVCLALVAILAAVWWRRYRSRG